MYVCMSIYVYYIRVYTYMENKMHFTCCVNMIYFPKSGHILYISTYVATRFLVMSIHLLLLLIGLTVSLHSRCFWLVYRNSDMHGSQHVCIHT